MFGHISRMEEKRILNIVMEGTHPQGRPRGKWIAIRVREWTGLSLGDMIHVAQDCKSWKRISDKLLISMAPEKTWSCCCWW